MCNLKYAASEAIAGTGLLFGTEDQSLGRPADSSCRMFLVLLGVYVLDDVRGVEHRLLKLVAIAVEKGFQLLGSWLEGTCNHLPPDSLNAQVTLGVPPQLVLIEGASEGW
jgi:hypothetical protein